MRSRSKWGIRRRKLCLGCNAAGKEGEFDPKLMEQLADDTLKREQEIEATAASEGEHSTTGKIESYSSGVALEEA